MRIEKRIQTVIWSVLMLSAVGAKAQTDSLYLDSTTITARKNTSAVAITSKGVSLDIEKIKYLPSLFGNGDPLGFAHYLPSMTAQTELENGLYIQGSEHSQNIVSSGGVPIYGAAHLLGIFSVFNPSHYRKMEYSTWAPWANRLGGSIDMPLPDSLRTVTSGELSAGLMSAQGTLRVPMGRKAWAGISARRSYMNMLYGRFLTMNDASGESEGTAVRYGFTDLNLTVMWEPSAEDRVWLDVYWGNDAMDGGESFYSVSAKAGWQNGMAALHWKHGGLEQSAYWTGYSLDFKADWGGVSAAMPSWLWSAGYRARYKAGDMTLSAESIHHEAQPQNPSVSGGYAVDIEPEPLQRAWENTLAVRWGHEWDHLQLEAGLKGSLYLSPEKEWFHVLDPYARIGWNMHRGGVLSARLQMQHQYLFRTGMTDMAMPTEFWLLAGRYSRPQTSKSVSIGYRLPFGSGAWTFETEAYYRLLDGQIEYKGNLMDFVNGGYSLDDQLLKGSGRAFGVNLQLSRHSGAFTGWVAYAYGRSLRSFGGVEYPSAHERLYELDAVLSWDLGRWTVGLTSILATGLPFTATEHLYLIGQKIIAGYGPHNGRRMKTYFRTDLSVNYWLKPQRSGLNLSVYNISGVPNEMYYHVWLNYEKREVSYGSVKMNLRFMPTVSYFCKF